MFCNNLSNENHHNLKGKRKYYYLVYKDAIKKIMDGANPDDVHKAINKDWKRFESRNEYEKFMLRVLSPE